MNNQEGMQHAVASSSLVDVLEKVLDKGIVIAGDIRINVCDIELLTIKIRLVIASIDKAKEIGITWWQEDPYLSTKAKSNQKEMDELKERVNILETVRTK